MPWMPWLDDGWLHPVDLCFFFDLLHMNISCSTNGLTFRPYFGVRLAACAYKRFRSGFLRALKDVIKNVITHPSGDEPLQASWLSGCPSTQMMGSIRDLGKLHSGPNGGEVR